MFAQKNYSKAIILIALITNLGLSASASDYFHTRFIEFGLSCLIAAAKTTAGKIALASSASAIACEAVIEYRASQPVAPPVLQACKGVQVIEEGVATLFAHGFGGNMDHAYAYRDILPGTIYTFNFPDANEGFVSLAHTGLGQPVEVDHLENALRQLGDRKDVKKIFVFGISRGGATVANLIKRQDIPHKEKIAGFIIEQSFGRVRDILKVKLGALHIQNIPGSMILAETVLKGICNQYSSSNQPADDTDSATPEMKAKPILVTCSQEDALIPHTSTEDLSRAFTESGFSKLRHVTFPHGQHVGLPFQASEYEYRAEMNNFIEDALRDHAAQS